MNLDQSQREKIATWIGDGLKLAEIQKRIGSELRLKLTYMEVRLLVDDLKLTPKDPEPPKPAPVPDGPVLTSAPATAPAPLAPVGEGATKPPGGVSVTVDQLARAGTLVSGGVTFSDGQRADWYLDQAGRLGVSPALQGYKPSAADVQHFQIALQDELAKLGL